MTDTKTAQEKALEAFEEILDGNFRYQRHYESAVAKVKAALQSPAVPREVLEFINDATKRSNYQWSEGWEYSALDHYNEGKIALAQRIVALLGGKE